MDFLKTFINFLKEVFPSLLAYKAGGDAKDKEQLKVDNEKLKEYDNIENGEHSVNDAYNSRLWK